MQPPGSALSLETVFLSRHSVERRIEVMTFNFTSIPHLVVGTDYIATVHTRLARQAQRLLPIKIVEPPFVLPKMQQTLQWHKYRSQDAGLIWLRGLVREAAKTVHLRNNSATQ
jgi:LysR family transcriptional regulator, nod-box dependent transcriptional activator